LVQMRTPDQTGPRLGLRHCPSDLPPDAPTYWMHAGCKPPIARVFIIFGGPQGHEDRPFGLQAASQAALLHCRRSYWRAESPLQRKALPHMYPQSLG